MDKEKFIKDVEKVKENNATLTETVYSWLTELGATEFFLSGGREVLVKDNKILVNGKNLENYKEEFKKEFYYDVVDLILRSFN